MVEQVCGIPRDAFLDVADAFCRASGPERTGAICYAVGWTQHSVGVQIIRTAAILQLLLGNIGRPGGGILALRGHASIQGSTDIPTLYDILPGYLPMPVFGADSRTLARYLCEAPTPTGWWATSTSTSCQPAEGVVRRRRDARKRVRLRLAAAHQPAITRTRATGSTWPMARASMDGPVRHGPEPGGRRAERARSSGARWRS